MHLKIEIDAQFGAFIDQLPPRLQHDAAELAYTLGLAPDPRISWSDVFKHEVTLAAPVLVAESMPGLSMADIRASLTAHMLAIIEAFGTDRIEDGQVDPTPSLRMTLAHIRIARDQAIRRIAGGRIGYLTADSHTLDAIAAEHKWLGSRDFVDFPSYERVSLGKQSVGLPASIALAHAAGWNIKRMSELELMLGSVWLGLQYYDDVVDWESDFQKGGAWAVSLAQNDFPTLAAMKSVSAINEIRSMVLSSGVLFKMLHMSEEHFKKAAHIAEQLGTYRLGSWAVEQEQRVALIAQNERDMAGYAVRAHSLAPWVMEVMK